MAREEVTHHTAPNSDQEDEGESMELGAQLPAELVVADSLPQVPSSEVMDLQPAASAPSHHVISAVFLNSVKFYYYLFF